MVAVAGSCVSTTGIMLALRAAVSQCCPQRYGRLRAPYDGRFLPAPEPGPA